MMQMDEWGLREIDREGKELDLSRPGEGGEGRARQERARKRDQSVWHVQLSGVEIFNTVPCGVEEIERVRENGDERERMGRKEKWGWER